MLTDSLDEREIAVLILALRFWRARRGDSVTRRSDAFVTPDTIDLLLAKLGSKLALIMSATSDFGSQPRARLSVIQMRHSLVR